MQHLRRTMALVLTGGATVAAVPSALAAGPAEPAPWNRSVDRTLTAKQLGLPSDAPARTLARKAIGRSAQPLGLPKGARGVRFAFERPPAPAPAGARPLRTLRFRQTLGGLRVVWSQINVTVAPGQVTSMSATTVPLTGTRLEGAARIGPRRALAVARRAVVGPETAKPAQLVVYAGTPGRPRAPRRAYVVQVTPATAVAREHADQDENLCVVVDAATGEVLTTWRGVAATPETARGAGTSARARAAQTTETNLHLVRDANFVASVEGAQKLQLFTIGNPFQPAVGEVFSLRLFPPPLSGIPTDVRLINRDMMFIAPHLCLEHGFCGRQGGFDRRTYKQFSITGQAPERTTATQSGVGTRYNDGQERVYIASSSAGETDVLAHELGHLVDHRYADDRSSDADQVLEIQEALADMYAYDFDRNDTVLGEPARINWADPSSITNPIDNLPYPAHIDAYKCNPSDLHLNATILSHAYHRMVIRLGHDKAGAVLHLANQRLPARPTFGTLRETFERTAEDAFGGDAENAVDAAFNEVGVKDATNPCA